MSSWKNLPTEILQQILDLLNNEDTKTSLRNCAVVCKSWTKLTQDVLYNRVLIYSKSGLVKLLHTLETNVELSNIIKAFASTYDNDMLLEKIYAQLPFLEEIDCAYCGNLPLYKALLESKLPHLKKITPLPPAAFISDSNTNDYISCALLLKNRLENLSITDGSGLDRDSSFESISSFHRLFDQLDQFDRLTHLVIEKRTNNEIELFKKIDSACPSLQDLHMLLKRDVNSTRRAVSNVDDIPKYSPSPGMKSLVCYANLSYALLSYIMHKYPSLDLICLRDKAEELELLDSKAFSQVMIYLSKAKEVCVLDLHVEPKAIMDAYKLYLNDENKSLQHVEFMYLPGHSQDPATFGVVKNSTEKKPTITYCANSETNIMNHVEFMQRYGKSIGQIALYLNRITASTERSNDVMLNGNCVIQAMEYCPNLYECKIGIDYIDPVAFAKYEPKIRYKLNLLDMQVRKLDGDALEKLLLFFTEIKRINISANEYCNSSDNQSDDSIMCFKIIDTKIGCLFLNLDELHYFNITNFYLKLSTKLDGDRYYKYDRKVRNYMFEASNEQEFHEGLECDNTKHVHISCESVEKVKLYQRYAYYFILLKL